jgi:hypothetical protein
MGAKLFSETFLVAVATGLVAYDWRNEEEEAAAAAQEQRAREA